MVSNYPKDTFGVHGEVSIIPFPNDPGPHLFLEEAEVFPGQMGWYVIPPACTGSASASFSLTGNQKQSLITSNRSLSSWWWNWFRQLASQVFHSSYGDASELYPQLFSSPLLAAVASPVKPLTFSLTYEQDPETFLDLWQREPSEFWPFNVPAAPHLVTNPSTTHRVIWSGKSSRTILSQTEPLGTAQLTRGNTLDFLTWLRQTLWINVFRSSHSRGSWCFEIQ